ncbi:MAG: hypothetical protein LC650_05850, partial [Actinobacteria bacterium]|nr:hypothetical protein [Actinomycetota bacterium]
MLSRLKFEIDPLVDEILDQLPATIWESDATTFLDPAMAGGQFIKAIIARLRKYSHSDENIARRVFGYEDYSRSVKYAVKTHNLIGTFEACNV